MCCSKTTTMFDRATEDKHIKRRRLYGERKSGYRAAAKELEEWERKNK